SSQISDAVRPGWQDWRTMATRMTSVRFVGRAEQLAELRAALHEAGEGRPSLALVGGESGVGKSRLADELIRHAREAGARVLTGDCVELGEDELPYAPLLTALRPLVRDGDPALDALAPSLRAALDAILPGLGEESVSGEATQSRVFEALLTLLDGLAQEAPAVLVIEDLHWADSSTRSFIGFLARSVCNERLLVLGTYRSDELHRRHPLRPLLAELSSDPYMRLIDLPRFSPEELGEQLEGIVGDRPDPELVQRVYSRSEGNALYAEEILAAGLDGRGSLPPTLRDALMLRVERLSPRAQELIRWLACQPAADHVLVAAVAGLDPTDLRDALREAVASHIVVTVGDESYGFRHALLREVVYEDLLPGERNEMHAALAGELETRIDSGDRGAHITAQAAHHWAAAGNQPRALAGAARAGLAAERVNAFGEAQALFERALSLWERVPEPEALAGIDEFELLRHAALAADQAGDPGRQEALLRRALQLVDAEADPDRTALIQERLSQSLWSQHRQDDSLAALREGLALLPDEPSAARAKLLAQLARRRMVQSRFAEAAECAREALSVARAVGYREAEAIALNALGTALGEGGEVDPGVAYLRESLEIAREEGLEMEEGGAWINISDVLNLAGRTEEALEAALQGLATAYTQDWRTTDWLRLSISEFRFHLGDWTGAQEAIPPASRRHTGGTLLYWHTCQAQLALGRGDEETAEEAIATLAKATADLTEPQFVGMHGILSAELSRRRGDIDAARIVIDDALDRIEYCSEDVVRVAALAVLGLRVEGDAGEAARDRRDEEGGALARTRADALLERSRMAAEAGLVVEAAQLATSKGEHARATGGDAVGPWRTAAEHWDELRRPYIAAYARWREAEALMAGRDREGASRAASAALASARRLGSAWLAEEVESLAARARLHLGEGAEAAAAAARPQSDDPFGLTVRERDVLALVAAGATNREIGVRLHMAEKTASVHVSRILAKLNVRSRTEAAAVAHRQGMAGTAPIG
ncbi:MAG TPA: AAA family ATPase, partial [Thermoleophilaceae bacterium]|nr:AAA family ATPase [Thermoleophilaceae bacterium]